MKGIKIENYSNYWIFPELGMVWSNPRKGTKGGWIGKPMNDGYWMVTLTDDNGGQKQYLLHRLIWAAVYGEIPDGMEINHKTENKDMNMISCLELVDRKTNCNYGTRNRRIGEKRSKVVEQCTLDGTVINVFPSTVEAGRCGYHYGAVAACCRGELKTHKGFIWRYAV